MKKIFNKATLVSIFTFSVMLLPVFPVYAQIQNPVVFDDLTEIINTYLGIFRVIVVIIFVGVLAGGGFVYLTAGSDEGKVANAKKMIIAAIVGFVIIVLAPAIVQFLGALLGVQGGLVNDLNN